MCHAKLSANDYNDEPCVFWKRDESIYYQTHFCSGLRANLQKTKKNIHTGKLLYFIFPSVSAYSLKVRAESNSVDLVEIDVQITPPQLHPILQ